MPAKASREPRRAIRRGPGRPPGPSRTARLRARLIEEASRLYAEGGHAGLSFGVLGERTGLRKATVFHYFPDKDSLVYAVFDAFGERLEAATVGCFDSPPARYADRLDRLIGALVDFYGADPLNARILCHGLLETEHTVSSRLAGAGAPPIFDHFVRRFGEFIAAGIAAGEFHPDRPQATIMSIGGVILFEFMLPSRWRLAAGTSGAVPLEERKREMIALIRRAVVRPAARLSKPEAGHRRGTR